jgi:hypothetical protein
MNSNLDKIAQDLYGKIQTRFSDIKIGDENANVLSKKEDIPNARFFEFEYEEGGEPLGTIAITLDENDGVVVQVSGDLVNDDDETTTHHAYKFIRSFRQFAKNRLLNFDIQNIGKNNLDKRDYQFQAKRKELPVMAQAPIMENKMYGNARMSYQDLGEARLVVKHSQPVNQDLAAGRTMHIEAIYIENAQGERFRYPAKHLNGARALAEHIKHGGNPYDAIGQHICGLSEELAGLRKFKGYVSRQEQVSEAMGNVTGRVIERIEEVKKEIQNLQKASYYEAFAESFEAQEEQMIPETVANDLIDRLTIRTFNEELKAVFPYIYKLVDESQLDVLEIGVDDILGEKAPPGDKAERMVKHIKAGYAKDGKLTDKEKSIAFATAWKSHNKKDESLDPENQFETFMNDIVREDKDELFSPNEDARRVAKDKLQQIVDQELKGGPNGINAVNSLKGLIDDSEFLLSLQDVDPDLDVRPLIQQYLLQRDPELSAEIDFSGEEEAEEPAPAPVAAPEPEPAVAPEPVAEPAPVAPAAEPVPVAPAPVAEDKDTDPPFDGPYTKSGGEKKDKFGNKIKEKNLAKHLAKQGMASAIEKAKKSGATLETQLDFGHSVKTIAEIIEDCGMQPQDFGYEADRESGLPAMLKYISGFYNKDEGNFPLGGQRIKIKVKKAFEDGEFGHGAEDDLIKVLKFIDLKDPSSDEQHSVLKLAGVSRPDHSMEETEQQSAQGQATMPNFGPLMQAIQTQLDAVSKGGQMDPDFSNQFGKQLQTAIAPALQQKMQQAQTQAPNQNVQIPGGQINPQDMMRQIMQKLNFNNQ